MKRKIVYLLMAMMFMMSACGKEDVAVDESREESVIDDKEKEDIAEEVIKEEADKESKEAKELGNWIGNRQMYGDLVEEGSIGFYVSYPTLTPSTNGKWAYQMDPALVLVTATEYDENNCLTEVDNIEDAFEFTKNRLIKRIKAFRDWNYSDYDFIVQSSELTTINEYEMCCYKGTHSYTYKGEAQEIPFVAYSFDTKQTEGHLYPFTIIVMDDSINNTTMDALEEGTIEFYAKKMAESVSLEE